MADAKKAATVTLKDLAAELIDTHGLPKGQVNTMLVKKIYGCLSLDDYRKGAAAPLKKKARARYTRLAKVAPKTAS